MAPVPSPAAQLKNFQDFPPNKQGQEQDQDGDLPSVTPRLSGSGRQARLPALTPGNALPLFLPLCVSQEKARVALLQAVFSKWKDTVIVHV